MLRDGKAQGETPEDRRAVGFADTLLDLGQAVVNAAAAGMADADGARN